MTEPRRRSSTSQEGPSRMRTSNSSLTKAITQRSKGKDESPASARDDWRLDAFSTNILRRHTGLALVVAAGNPWQCLVQSIQGWSQRAAKVIQDSEKNLRLGIRSAGNRGRRLLVDDNQGRGCELLVTVYPHELELLQGEALAIIISESRPPGSFRVEKAQAFRRFVSSVLRRNSELPAGSSASSSTSSVRVHFGGLEFPAFPFPFPAPSSSLSSSSSSSSRSLSTARTWRAFIPSTPLQPPGLRVLKVELTSDRDDGSGNWRYEKKIFEQVVILRAKEYPVESIWLSKGKSNIRGTPKEANAVNNFLTATPSRSSSNAVTVTVTTTNGRPSATTRKVDDENDGASKAQRWTGPFLAPSDGEITTAYGLRRFYNGRFADAYYHRGIDYGAEMGSPVRAPGTGRVALVGREADGFEIHGNCVGLDHGQGVTSMLMHLSTICVEEGAIVKQGQLVGRVGETGMATGPHLHWGFYIHGEAVDPDFWMENQPWL